MFANRCFGLAAFLSVLSFGAARNADAQGAAPSGSPVRSGLQSEGSSRPSEAQVEVLELQVGEQRVLPAHGVRRYSEGAKGIVDVRLTSDASQFVLVALAPGTTTLLFLMMDDSERHYKITVPDPNAAKRRGHRPLEVQARDNIRLDFYFVELSRSYAHQVGIGWPGSIAPTFSATADVQAGALESATAVITNQALPRLDIAQASGWAKVQRQAAVVTANGERASFSGGGEVNVPIQGALSSGIQKIAFGSIVEVEPNYDSKSGRIELGIHADISELDSDRGTGVPGRTSSALNTIVNLELGQSLVLAGLSAKSERRSKAGLPGLSQIPLLGILFGSHTQAEEQSESVVLIVPSVVDAVSMQDKKLLDDALRNYVEYSGDLDKVRLVPSRKPHQGRSGAAVRRAE